MGVLHSSGVGRYHTGESDLTLIGANYTGGGPLVIVCHGTGTSPASYMSPASGFNDLDLLAEQGYVVVVPDLAGANTWGLDSVVHATTGRIQEVRTTAASLWAADITKTVLIGDSMGGMNALGAYWRAPSNFKGCVLRCPVVLADALHDRDPGGLGALIDTAYGGGANWEADKANRDPNDASHITQIAAVKSRVQIWYSTNDTTILTSDITTYTGSTGVKAIPFGAVGHAPFGSHVPAAAQAAFIKSCIAT